MIVRSLHVAFDVPDTSAALASVYYPGDETTLEAAKLTGRFDAVTTDAPWPIVILMPGINVGADSYRWLAVRLVEAGFCAVTYAAIGALGPAGQGITPGMDMAALAPDVIGTRPSASAIGPLLDRLRALDDVPVAGLLDFDRIGLCGHSAGGTVALHNTNPDWIPGLRAVFGYGAHTMTSTSLGQAEATVVAVPSGVPIMLMAGAHDGVIAASRDRYRSDTDDHDPIERTFAEAIKRDEQDSWLVLLANGNHFTICDPVDETSGRSFLEADLRAHDAAPRMLLAEVVVAFFDSTMHALPRTGGVDALTKRDGIASWARR